MAILRDKRLQFKCTKDELEDVKAKASELGFDDYATYLRALIWDPELIEFKKKSLKK